MVNRVPTLDGYIEVEIKDKLVGLQYCYRTDILYTSPKSEAWLLLAVGR